MATRKMSRVTETAAKGGSIRICFERILPDDIDPGHAARRAMREALAAGLERSLDASQVLGLSRMAVALSKKWDNASTVKCRFLDGSPKMRKRVEAIAHQWEKYANIKLKFVASGTAEVRISFFADTGSWSAVGKDALVQQYFPLHQPTMNYGWLRDDTAEREYSRVVLHEFGHALGALHEHQSPNFTRKWNVTAVMKYFAGPPNYWSPEDIKSNVLEKYSPRGIGATKFDPESIMLYEFDGPLFSDGGGPTNSNVKLSATDVAFIKSMYPK